MYRALLLVILLVTNVSWAAPTEVLDCGVTIVKNVKGQQDIKVLNKICSNVLAQYHRLYTTGSSQFKWNISLLPIEDVDSGYRAAKRVKTARKPGHLVDGYTDPSGYSLVVNDRYFKVVFAHELFHALNDFYHLSNGDREEDMAEQFTIQLGYGK